MRQVIGGAQAMIGEGTVLGRGIYSLSDAAALTGLKGSGISRYVWGYSRHVGDRLQRYDPIFDGDYSRAKGAPPAVSFLDLTELRLIREFRSAGVPWKEVRRTSRKIAEMLQRAHPFSTLKFYTDGRRILHDVLTPDSTPEFQELATKQMAFKKLLGGVVRGFEFESEELVRWAPVRKNHLVVLDPGRSFGQPILRESGVPARALCQAVRALKSTTGAADWYRVPEAEVRAALEFERFLAA